MIVSKYINAIFPVFKINGIEFPLDYFANLGAFEEAMTIDIIHNYSKRILAGESVKVETKSILDRLLPLLEKENHKGIVLGGSNPWIVSIIPSVKMISIDECEVGKYYTSAGPKYKDFFVERRDSKGTYWTYTNKYFPSGPCSWTGKDYKEISRPDKFDGKKAVYVDQLVDGKYYKGLAGKYRDIIIRPTNEDTFYILDSVYQSKLDIKNIPFVEVVKEWREINK